MATAQKQSLPQSVDLASLEGAIKQLSDIGKQLQSSKLKPRTIILLLHDLTGVGKRDIEYILNALPQLQAVFLKP